MAIDALIVGGGPAGASAAFHLARAGANVRLVERARFPRAKPCAECLSPASNRILREMGALAMLEPHGSWQRGMMVRSPGGATAFGDYETLTQTRHLGLSVRREVLDRALFERAREAGVDALERTRCVGLLFDSHGAVDGATLQSADGRCEDVRAPLVIAADGLRSIIARRLGLSRRYRWPGRIALVGHYRNVKGVRPYVEMHVQRDGFVGIADVGDGLTTVAAVFPSGRAREFGGRTAAFLDRWLAGVAHLRARFAPATLEGPVRAVGPFASRSRRAWHPGALLVGDAADFLDPFTGEGIYAALRGGEMIGALAPRLLASQHATRTAALREYERLRRREFGGKWWVESLVAVGVALPFVADRAIGAMSAKKELADRLACVTGDLVPPRSVLNARYLASLFLTPTVPGVDVGNA